MSRDTITTALVHALCLLIVAVVLFLAANGPIRLGLLIYTEQLVALVLGASIALGLLTRSAGGIPQTRASVSDIVLALLALGAALHIAIRFPVLSQQFYQNLTESTVTAAVLVPLLFEALRRTTGWGLLSVVLLFLGYALVADKVPGQLQGRAVVPLDFLPFLAIDNTAIFGTPLRIVVNIVIAYVLFGSLLLATGGSKWFTDLAISLVGRSRGGSAKIAILASTFFGSISGSAVANVASTGIITIPLMKKSGFQPRTAAAFEAVASTGGQIMPPVMGAAAFLMAEFLRVGYTEVVIAAAMPALLFVFAVLVQADLEARRLDVPPVPDDMVRPVGAVFRAGWYFPIPFAVLISALFVWNRAPAEAALYAAGVLLVASAAFGHEGKRLTPRQLYDAVVATGKGSLEIVAIGAVAGVVIAVLESTGLGFGLTFILIELGRDSLFLLLVLSAVICVLLGMGMPTTGIYLLVVTLAAPPLIELGVDPMAAHLFILYFGLMSMISPPVAIAAFTAASIAQTAPMRTAVTSLRLGWPVFVIPFVFVYSPALLLRAGPVANIAAIGATTLGVWCFSTGVVGYFRSQMGVAGRLGAILAAAAAFLFVTVFT
ncbi:C4-dicarboxylate ABC transporter permease [Rhodobacteraceae bacterium WD3A24]|nr:C4-dicarboxylate ABC transporter permease [Rhodobacteraceae bacterium WD3A24]